MFLGWSLSHFLTCGLSDPKASLMVKTELQKIAFEDYSFRAKLGYGNRRREAENGEMRISSVKLS